jgi:hypothetical protein
MTTVASATSEEEYTKYSAAEEPGAIDRRTSTKDKEV